MAELHVEHLWQITLNTSELRLVLKALGGRLVAEKEKNEADILGDRLTKLRASQLKQSNDTVAKLEHALWEKSLGKEDAQ